jgi:hypothetical protein
LPLFALSAFVVFFLPLFVLSAFLRLQTNPIIKIHSLRSGV